MAKAKADTADTSLSIPFLQDVTEVLDRVRKDIEATVENVGNRAVDLLPEGGREQLDNVMERLDDVRDDVNKSVGSLRKDIEKRFDVVRGTIDKRVAALRKETEGRRKNLEKAAQKRAVRVFKWFNLPVRNDLDAIKRRLTALERRIEAIEKHRTSRVAA